MNKDVIIALDFPTLEDTMNFLEKFGEEKLFVKVGMELYLQNGGGFIQKLLLFRRGVIHLQYALFRVF